MLIQISNIQVSNLKIENEERLEEQKEMGKRTFCAQVLNTHCDLYAEVLELTCILCSSHLFTT